MEAIPFPPGWSWKNQQYSQTNIPDNFRKQQEVTMEDMVEKGFNFFLFTWDVFYKIPAYRHTQEEYKSNIYC